TLVLAGFFIAADMSYSAAIFYTGTLAPFDASYYAAKSVGALPFSIATAEWLTLVILPLVYLGLALWKLRQLRREQGFRIEGKTTSVLALILIATLIPPLAPGLELNTARPSYLHQMLEFAS